MNRLNYYKDIANKLQFGGTTSNATFTDLVPLADRPDILYLGSCLYGSINISRINISRIKLSRS